MLTIGYNIPAKIHISSSHQSLKYVKSDTISEWRAKGSAKGSTSDFSLNFIWIQILSK